MRHATIAYDYDTAIRTQVHTALAHARALHNREGNPEIGRLRLLLQRLHNGWHPGAAGKARRALAEWRTTLAAQAPVTGRWRFHPYHPAVAANQPGTRLLVRATREGGVILRHERFEIDGTLTGVSIRVFRPGNVAGATKNWWRDRLGNWTSTPETKPEPAPAPEPSEDPVVAAMLAATLDLHDLVVPA